eukprot:TRINITY_DN3742_c0_g1_i2.p1 TRINITY_DN3742_c0_g1~~TRINITY_DN3742_c0_g1_i2.p1  ORF type:complete len:259 (+),score=100.90 TRINITY_DN3742_c0_g1_i2:96-779(+)
MPANGAARLGESDGSPSLKPGVENLSMTSRTSSTSSHLPTFDAKLHREGSQGRVSSHHSDAAADLQAVPEELLEGPCAPEALPVDLPEDLGTLDMAQLFTANYALLMHPLHEFLSDTAQHQLRIAQLLDATHPRGPDGVPESLSSCLQTPEVKEVQKTLSQLPHYTQKLQQIAASMKAAQEKTAGLRATAQRVAQQRKWELQEKRQKNGGGAGGEQNESGNAFGLLD